MGHVDGTCVAPRAEIDGELNPQYITWLRRNQFVLSWIVGSVSESILLQIVGAESALVTWQKLATAYASGSKVQVCVLKGQLHSLRRGNESISTYMERAKSIADQLAAL